MAEIVIVIHANSIWNEAGLWQGHNDSELSDSGHEMALLLADNSNLKNIDYLYSSDLKRAYETIQPLATRLGLAINKDPYLREGNWEITDSQAGTIKLAAPYDYENYFELSNRAKDTLASIANKHINSFVLIMTHGAFLESFIATIFPDELNQYKGIRTAINRFHYFNGGWRIVELNEHSHLKQLKENMYCVTTNQNLHKK